MILLACLLLSGAGCKSSAEGAAERTVEGGSPHAEHKSSGLVTLPVQGYPPALVSAPAGSAEPRLMLVVLYGSHSPGDSLCSTWRQVVGDEPFVICVGHPPTPGKPAAAQLDSVLEAAARRFAKRVASRSVVLAAHGSAVAPASQMALEQPARFNRLAFVGGDLSAWTASSVTHFLQLGGLKVLFVCEDEQCSQAAGEIAVALMHARGDARVLFPGTPGTGLTGRLLDLTKAQWEWLQQEQYPSQPGRPASSVPSGSTSAAVPPQSPAPVLGEPARSSDTPAKRSGLPPAAGVSASSP
jgi:hypothetical protein